MLTHCALRLIGRHGQPRYSRGATAPCFLSAARHLGMAPQYPSWSPVCARTPSAAPVVRPLRPASTAAVPNKKYTYVCLGGGNGAGYLAQAMVEKNLLDSSTMCIISDEDVHPYERPALSKGFLNASNPARLPGFHTCVGKGLPAQLPSWYEDCGIDVLLNTRAVKIDGAAKSVTLGDGATIEFDKLICATGLKERQLPLEPRNNHDVFYLRTVAQATALYAAMEQRAQQRAVVIGGGYIGTEAAAKLSEMGIQTTVVMQAPHVLHGFFNEELAAFYQAEFDAHNISIIPSASVKGLRYTKENVLEGVQLSSGATVECDFVVAGVGSVSELSLYENVVDCKDGGIVANEYLRTSHPDIFAIGDVARFPLSIAGDIVFAQHPHVPNARQSAAHLASVFACLRDGEPLAEYETVPGVYSACLGVSWRCQGLREGDLIVLPRKDPKQFGAAWVKDGKVVGLLASNAGKDVVPTMRQIVIDRPIFDKEETRLRIATTVFGEN